MKIFLTSLPGPAVLLPASFLILTPHKILSLEREVSLNEVRATIFSMGPYKSPGRDGFHPLFFSKILGCEWLRSSPSRLYGLHSWKFSLLYLIPKFEHAETIRPFCPIRLCNLAYKAVTKVITSRLKPILMHVIGRDTSSFLPERQTRDNIILAQELIPIMRKKSGKQG